MMNYICLSLTNTNIFCDQKIEALVKSIDRYQNGSTQMREKLGKMKSMRKRITESLRQNEVLVTTTKEDAIMGNSKRCCEVKSEYLTQR